jgi:hypothetical protein
MNWNKYKVAWKVRNLKARLKSETDLTVIAIGELLIEIAEAVAGPLPEQKQH